MPGVILGGFRGNHVCHESAPTCPFALRLLGGDDSANLGRVSTSLAAPEHSDCPCGCIGAQSRSQLDGSSASRLVHIKRASRTRDEFLRRWVGSRPTNESAASGLWMAPPWACWGVASDGHEVNDQGIACMTTRGSRGKGYSYHRLLLLSGWEVDRPADRRVASAQRRAAPPPSTALTEDPASDRGPLRIRDMTFDSFVSRSLSLQSVASS